MECAAIGSKLEGYLNKNVTDYLNSSSMDRYGVWATDAEIISTRISWAVTSMCTGKWARSSTGKNFLHSSLSANQLMLTWTTVRVTTTTLF